MDFKELRIGDWLICSINIEGVVRKNGIYQIEEIIDYASHEVVILSAERGNEVRVYEKDYENEFGAFKFYERGTEYSSSPPTATATGWKSFDTLLETKAKLPPSFTSPSVRAKALRYEQEYLLDSLRTSDDLEENEKDMLRLKEIGEELESLTAYSGCLEEHVEWR